MKFENVWVASTGSALGERRSPAFAIAEGQFPRDSAKSANMTSVCESAKFPVDFAVEAGKAALEMSKVSPHNVALHIFCNITFPGLYMWPASHYVSSKLIPNFSGLSFSCDAMSASSVVALEIAATMMEARSDIGCSLITAGDSFRRPEVDRWNHDPSLVFGDGGGAVLLSRDMGWAKLLSIVSHTEHDLEGMHRGDETFSNLVQSEWPVNQRQRYRDYFSKQKYTVADVTSRQVKVANTVMSRALAEAGIVKKDIRCFVFPFVGKESLAKEFARPLGVSLDRTMMDFGCRTGHLGSADQLVGLCEIQRKSLVSSGEIVALVGMGAGQTWSVAILRIA